MARERMGYIFMIILDPEYVFSPPETPANCTQQQISPPSIHSGDVYIYLHIPASPRFTPCTPRPPIRHPRHLKHPYPPLLTYPTLPMGVTSCYLWLSGN